MINFLSRIHFVRIGCSVIGAGALLFMSACAKTTGGEVAAPKIPIVQHKMAYPTPVLLNAEISSFQDSRPNQNSSSGKSVTMPVGEVGTLVSKAAEQAFKKRGMELRGAGGMSTIRGRIIEWSATVDGGALPVLGSVAALEVEVVGPEGRPVYTSSYEGTRSSQFPVISESDIQESLGIAMAEALEKMADDRMLTSAISK